MTEKELSEKLEALAAQVLPWNNSTGKADSVRKLLRFFEAVDPQDFRELRKAIFLIDSEVKPYESMLPLVERLEKLAIRLDDDGNYTDSDICWLALKNIKTNT